MKQNNSNKNSCKNHTRCEHKRCENHKHQEKRKLQVTLFSIFALLSISLFISACGGGGGNSKIVNTYVGTEGVSLEFTTNNPPSEVYEDSNALVFVELWNKGAHPLLKEDNELNPILVTLNLDRIYFDVQGYGEKALTGTDGYLDYALDGKSVVWPIGEKTIIPIANLKVKKIAGTRESPMTQVSVSACYPYKTYFAESICIDTDMYELEKNPICQNLRQYSYAGQGAPVIVSKIEVDMIPVVVGTNTIEMNTAVVNESGHLQGIEQGNVESNNIIIRPYFRIYFKNVDKGVILASDEGENPCIDGPTQNGEAIRITAMLGNMPLTCYKPEIKIYSNEGSVRCYLEEEDVSGQYELNRNYELPLKIEAEYFYKVTTSKDIKIIRIS